MKRKLLTLLSFIAINIVANAQSDTVATLELLYYQWNPDAIQLQQYKNKQAVIIDRNYLKAVSADQVDQALRAVGGVDIRQRGASGVQVDVGIDGGSFDQTMVLVNGLKLTDPQTGHNMMMLPFEFPMVKSIQVIKGAASSMYGVNALAGTINLLTKTPAKNFLETKLIGGSSFEQNGSGSTYNNTGIQLQGGKHIGKFFHQLQTGWKGSNGYRHNTAHTSPNIWYQTEGRVGQHNVQIMGGYRYLDFGANGFYAAPGDSNSQETVQNTVIGLKHAVPIHNRITWHNDAVYLYKTDDYKYIKEPVIGRNIHYQNTANYTSALNWRTNFGTIKTGIEWRYEDLNSSNLGRRNRNNLGVLLNYDVMIRQRVSVETGIYANHNTDFGLQFYPNLGLGYFLTANDKLVANISSGQRLPTFTDLYYKQRGVIEGNPNLKAEQAWNAEVGYQYKGGQEQLTAYVFYRSIDQFIDWTRANVADVWRPNNYRQLNTLGLHLSWQQHKQIATRWNLGYILSYNYLNPSLALGEEGVISRYAINALRHHGVAGVYATWNDQLKIQAGANVYERISYKQYTLFNASIHYNIHRFSTGLSVTNLTNAQVKEAGANTLPGRWFQAHVGYKLF